MLTDDSVMSLLDHVEVALVRTDGDLRVTAWNRFAQTLLGWPAEEAIGRNVVDLLVGEADLEAAQAIVELLREGHSWHGDFPVRHRDGTDIVVAWKATPILDDDRRFLGSASIGLDITERHGLEQDRALRLEIERATRQQVEISERRLAFLLEVSEALGAATTLPQALQAVARLTTRDLAEICIFDVFEGDRLTRMAALHQDPEKQHLVAQLAHYPPDLRSVHPAVQAIRAGEVGWANDMTAEFVRSASRSEEHFDLVSKLGFRSYVSVPLRGRRRIFGALTLVRTHGMPGYTQADVRLATDLGRRASLAIEATGEMEARRAIAHQLQRSLLPPVLPSLPGYEIGASYVAEGEGLEVGGDFYDIFATPDGWWMAIGDVCGRGAGAAAVTGLVRHTLRALALHESSPATVLEQLNRVLLAEESQDRFVTLCLLLLPTDGAGRFSIASAGHPLPVVVRADGTRQFVGSPGDLLGVIESVEVPVRTSSLLPGDALVLYTDGVTERREGSRVLGDEGLLELLDGSPALPAQAVADAVAEGVAGFQPMPALDDMAVLVLRAVDNSRDRGGAGPTGPRAHV